jgi:hypothetical protein
MIKNDIQLHNNWCATGKINNCKNTMYELLKTNTAVWFNKICKNSQLTPKYVNIINIKDNNQQNKTCSNKIQTN